MACEQRGGIHSDPLVRLLAFRAWGDRDRSWRPRDSARMLGAGARSIVVLARFSKGYGFDKIEMSHKVMPRERPRLVAHRGGQSAEIEVPRRGVGSTSEDNDGERGILTIVSTAFANQILDALDILDRELTTF
jgi:hypothetical protein